MSEAKTEIMFFPAWPPRNLEADSDVTVTVCMSEFKKVIEDIEKRMKAPRDPDAADIVVYRLREDQRVLLKVFLTI